MKKLVQTTKYKNITYSFFHHTPEIYYKVLVPASSLVLPFYPLSSCVDAMYYSTLD